ncbi:hypothetical protein IGI04_022031 [Brassica rapa subsp. trilocularis]|uniref:Uncharacterized protein n=2 Tax=Brassica TaxID=3705 RepID=A0ABQ8CY60_BRANA|nr:hypothetical protein IGI04_022031 [Brassica rapa subsp. trilocularis]KAH0921488.1 hypothetical protein HID58_021506 [Brassica napus]
MCHHLNNKERHASPEHLTVTDLDPNSEVTAGENRKRPRNSPDHAGIITPTPELTGTFNRTTETTSNNCIGSYMDSVSSIAHDEENQSKESRSHPSSGSHHHNEPLIDLGHSPGNQTNHPISDFSAISVKDDRNTIRISSPDPDVGWFRRRRRELLEARRATRRREDRRVPETIIITR